MYDNANMPLGGDLGGLTDDDISNLDAVDKLSLLKQAAAEAAKAMSTGPDLTTEELALIADYREWKKSPKCASGVFHWRRHK